MEKCINHVWTTHELTGKKYCSKCNATHPDSISPISLDQILTYDGDGQEFELEEDSEQKEDSL